MLRSLIYAMVMKRHAILLFVAVTASLGFTSCVKDPEQTPVGPVSETSKIPWNAPIAGQGQGQFGMMQQNQYRR